MKYLVVQAPSGEVPVLFGRGFMHRYVATILAPMPVVAAGFVRRQGEVIECYGRSAGLNIAARPGPDTRLIEQALAEGTN